MRYLRNTFKAQLGDVLQVSISKPTRVLVLTSKQFKKYKENQTFIYFGGNVDKDYEFSIPKSGKWTVVIEKGSYHKPIDIKAKLALTRGGGVKPKAVKAKAVEVAPTETQEEEA